MSLHEIYGQSTQLQLTEHCTCIAITHTSEYVKNQTFAVSFVKTVNKIINIYEKQQIRY